MKSAIILTQCALTFESERRQAWPDTIAIISRSPRVFDRCDPSASSCRAAVPSASLRGTAYATAMSPPNCSQERARRQRLSPVSDASYFRIVRTKRSHLRFIHVELLVLACRIMQIELNHNRRMVARVIPAPRTASNAGGANVSDEVGAEKNVIKPQAGVPLE